MSPWKGERKDSWASNPNLVVYIFGVLFVTWLGFHIWANLGGPPAPDEALDPMVMTALGVAIQVKSSERNRRTEELVDKVKALEDVAAKEHPEEAAQHAPPLDNPLENPHG